MLGRPSGTAPMTSTPGARPEATTADVARMAQSSLKRARSAKGPPNFAASGFAESSHRSAAAATSAVGPCGASAPVTTSPRGAPSMSRSMDLTMSSAEPLMKPESAGRERKRTRNERRRQPMSASVRPTSRASVAACAERAASSAGHRFRSCSPDSSATSAPVPTEPSCDVPSRAYAMGASTQAYGPWMGATPQRCACASDCARSTKPIVKPPAASPASHAGDARRRSQSRPGRFWRQDSGALPFAVAGAKSQPDDAARAKSTSRTGEKPAPGPPGAEPSTPKLLSTDA
mmetsp:Transcript_13887/g.41353  ORF Transcript_13887/g.41353 Transcript_13887/m.41353 type:complete len:289 (-) Transcript_13887:208-1074(-)